MSEMHYFTDNQGRKVRMTEERNEHLHRYLGELPDIIGTIEATLRRPDTVVPGDSDRLRHYRWFEGTPYGDKFSCVVVVTSGDDWFMVAGFPRARIR